MDFQNSIACTLIFLLLWLLYKYTTRNHQYWKQQNVPGPKAFPFFGTTLSFMQKPAFQVDMECRRQFGHIYGGFRGNEPILVVGEPDALKSIMVRDWHIFVNRENMPLFDEVFSKNLLMLRDEKWKRVRATMSPTFTSRKMNYAMDMVKGCANKVLIHLNKLTKKTNDVDVKQLFGFYTMDVIAKCAFGLDIDCHANSQNAFLRNAYEFFDFQLLRTLVFLVSPYWIMKKTRFNLLSTRALEFFKEVAKHAISQRKEAPMENKDFLQLLLEAEESKDPLEVTHDYLAHDGSNGVSKEDVATGWRKSTKLTETEIVAQSVLFLVAGYETTSSLLTYCAYALALNPDVQDKLYAEIKDVLKEESNVNNETVGKLLYLNAVVYETLRLYTPVTRMNREAVQDYRLESSGITIKKGTLVVIPFYAIHHDENYFPEPFSFKPDRFLPENANNVQPYTFLPFGAGPRYCIGLRFALAEAKIMICKLLLTYKIDKSLHTKEPLTFRKSFNFLLVESVEVKLSPRNDCNQKCK